MTIMVKMDLVGVQLHKYVKYDTFVTFFECPVPSCPVIFLWHASRSNRWIDFHYLWLKLHAQSL